MVRLLSYYSTVSYLISIISVQRKIMHFLLCMCYELSLKIVLIQYDSCVKSKISFEMLSISILEKVSTIIFALPSMSVKN